MAKTIKPASPTEAGIMKLYKDRGYNTDGTITQKKVTEGFDSIKFKIIEDEEECFELEVDF